MATGKRRSGRYVVKVDNLYVDTRSRLTSDQWEAMVYEEALSYAGKVYRTAKEWATLEASLHHHGRVVRLVRHVSDPGVRR